ncbi:MAG: flagellar biosynthetic protein FliP [Paracoccaceae bacterium]|jgi:flagellar biosynthetic protein FliP
MNRFFPFVFALLALILMGVPLYAQESLASQLGGLPALSSTTGADGETQYSLSLQILALMTALTVLPSLVLGMTSFTRIIIVLSILRQAMGTQQTPPNQVLIAIALFLSFFIMSPTLNTINTNALAPYMAEEMAAEEAVRISGDVLKEFMIVNTREDALLMFKDMANDPDYGSNADIPFSTLMPAFITSELKTAFQIGFLLFLPFLVIDMVIASILMSLGMMMLSPMLVSLPFKLLLFVLVDGWAMTVGSLAATFMTGAGG